MRPQSLIDVCDDRYKFQMQWSDATWVSGTWIFRCRLRKVSDSLFLKAALDLEREVELFEEDGWTAFETIEQKANSHWGF